MTKTSTNPLAVRLSEALDIYVRGGKEGRTDWQDQARETLDLLEDFLPSGSGICARHLDREKSTGQKIVVTFCYQHYNDNGYESGVTKHTVVVTPSFGGFGYEVKVTGRNRNDVLSYLHETFYWALSASIEMTWDADTKTKTFRVAPETDTLHVMIACDNQYLAIATREKVRKRLVSEIEALFENIWTGDESTDLHISRADDNRFRCALYSVDSLGNTDTTEPMATGFLTLI